MFAKGRRFRVPLSGMASAREKNNAVAVSLKDDFGFETCFLHASMTLYWPWREHPILKELMSHLGAPKA